MGAKRADPAWMVQAGSVKTQLAESFEIPMPPLAQEVAKLYRSVDMVTLRQRLAVFVALRD